MGARRGIGAVVAAVVAAGLMIGTAAVPAAASAKSRAQGARRHAASVCGIAVTGGVVRRQGDGRRLGHARGHAVADRSDPDAAAARVRTGRCRRPAEHPDGGHRGGLRRPDRGGRSGHRIVDVRSARVHDRQRLLPQGRPDRRHELPGARPGLGARGVARRADHPRRRAARPHPARRGQDQRPRRPDDGRDLRGCTWHRGQQLVGLGRDQLRRQAVRQRLQQAHPHHGLDRRRRLRCRVAVVQPVRHRRRRHDARRRRQRQPALRDGVAGDRLGLLVVRTEAAVAARHRAARTAPSPMCRPTPTRTPA